MILTTVTMETNHMSLNSSVKLFKPWRTAVPRHVLLLLLCSALRFRVNSRFSPGLCTPVHFRFGGGASVWAWVCRISKQDHSFWTVVSEIKSVRVSELQCTDVADASDRYGTVVMATLQIISGFFYLFNKIKEFKSEPWYIILTWTRFIIAM